MPPGTYTHTTPTFTKDASNAFHCRSGPEIACCLNYELHCVHYACGALPWARYGMGTRTHTHAGEERCVVHYRSLIDPCWALCCVCVFDDKTFARVGWFKRPSWSWPDRPYIRIPTSGCCWYFLLRKHRSSLYGGVDNGPLERSAPFCWVFR